MVLEPGPVAGQDARRRTVRHRPGPAQQPAGAGLGPGARLQRPLVQRRGSSAMPTKNRCRNGPASPLRHGGSAVDDLVAGVAQRLGGGVQGGPHLGVDLDPDRARLGGDADPQGAARGRDRPVGVGPGEHVQHQPEVGHGGGQGPELAHPAQGRGAAGRERDHAEPGLDADQPAVGGGHADRAAPVGGQGDGDHGRGDRGGAAARGAAGVVVQAPGVAGDPEGLALGERPQAQLGQAGLADQQRPGLAQAPDQLGVGGGRLRLVAAEPLRVGAPARSTLSLMATGTPASGSPARSRAGPPGPAPRP